MESKIIGKKGSKKREQVLEEVKHNVSTMFTFRHLAALPCLKNAHPTSPHPKDIHIKSSRIFD